jgi:hypothetical protein
LDFALELFSSALSDSTPEIVAIKRLPSSHLNCVSAVTNLTLAMATWEKLPKNGQQSFLARRLEKSKAGYSATSQWMVNRS